jgi:hypothetical protein
MLVMMGKGRGLGILQEFPCNQETQAQSLDWEMPAVPDLYRRHSCRVSLFSAQASNLALFPGAVFA